jgi:ABC-type bacteriocin/lantibiotic exporter with double-glycine peptidase domain
MKPVAGFLILAAALCQGCAMFVSVPALDPLPRSEAILADVEYVPQEASSDCGPACLATVMRYYGSPLTLSEVAARLKPAKDGGTLLVEMVFAARSNGFPATSFREGGINDLRRSILDGKPLILFIHPTPDIVKYTPWRRGHYVVAVGFDDEKREAVIHSGTKTFDTMSYRQLQLQWGRSRFLTVQVEK